MIAAMYINWRCMQGFDVFRGLFALPGDGQTRNLTQQQCKSTACLWLVVLGQYMRTDAAAEWEMEARVPMQCCVPKCSIAGGLITDAIRGCETALECESFLIVSQTGNFHNSLDELQHCLAIAVEGVIGWKTGFCDCGIKFFLLKNLMI